MARNEKNAALNPSNTSFEFILIIIIHLPIIHLPITDSERQKNLSIASSPRKKLCNINKPRNEYTPLV